MPANIPWLAKSHTACLIYFKMELVSEAFKEAVGKRLIYRKLVNIEIAMCVGIARAKNADLPPAAEKLCVMIRKVTKV